MGSNPASQLCRFFKFIIMAKVKFEKGGIDFGSKPDQGVTTYLVAGRMLPSHKGYYKALFDAFLEKGGEIKL